MGVYFGSLGPLLQTTSTQHLYPPLVFQLQVTHETKRQVLGLGDGEQGLLRGGKERTRGSQHKHISSVFFLDL